jgi:hypothetical protein
MEDRRTPWLYLEMSDAEPGGPPATWWRNVVPHRKDLPRRLPEFSTLAVHELSSPEEAPPGVEGMLFRRTPRPPQGRLTGRPTLGLSVVLITPKTDEQATALRDWADFVHISHIAAAAVPGITMITPYERVDGDSPRYLHLYEMDTDDPEAAFQAMAGLVAARLGGRRSAAWDAWAWHPALLIDYVNSFRRDG